MSVLSVDVQTRFLECAGGGLVTGAGVALERDEVVEVVGLAEFGRVD